MNPNRRFAVAYAIVITFFLSLGASAVITTAALHGRTAGYPDGFGPCPIITEKTFPEDVDRCIAGPLGEKGKFSQHLLGLPKDGYCQDYTNRVSWRVIKCMGTQPESQPG